MYVKNDDTIKTNSEKCEMETVKNKLDRQNCKKT